MTTIDSLNKKFNNEVITWAIAKKPQEWAMNRNSLSSGSTTDITKIPNIMI
jgi:DNA polymerase V